MSVVKLLSRIRNPLQIETHAEFRDELVSRLDPLTEFALVFAAMVHDVGKWALLKEIATIS